MKNKMADYLNGEHAMSPEQLTTRMAETAKSNPTYDYSQNIRKTFEDTVKNHGIEAGHQFVQGLREPQQKAQALATLAVEHGQITDATLSMIDYSHNIVPTSTTLKTGFDHARNLFVATLTPHDGGQPTKYALTPAQMHNFLTGPASQFDHIAENGSGKNLGIASGGGNAVRDLQLLSDPHAAGPTSDERLRQIEPQVAGLTKFLPTGYLDTQAGRDALVRVAEDKRFSLDNTSDVSRAGIARELMRIAPPTTPLPAVPDGRAPGERTGYINGSAAPFQAARPATGAPLPPQAVDRTTPVGSLTPRQLDAARTQLTPQDAESQIQRQKLGRLVGPEVMPYTGTDAQKAEWSAKRGKLIEDYRALQRAAEPISPAIVRANTRPVSTDPRVLPKSEEHTLSQSNSEQSSSSTGGSSSQRGTGPSGQSTGGRSGSTSSSTSGSKSSSGTRGEVILIPGTPASPDTAAMEANRQQQAADAANASAWNAMATQRQAEAQKRLEAYGPAPWDRPGWHSSADRPLPETVFQRGPIAAAEATQQPAAPAVVQERGGAGRMQPAAAPSTGYFVTPPATAPRAVTQTPGQTATQQPAAKPTTVQVADRSGRLRTRPGIQQVAPQEPVQTAAPPTAQPAARPQATLAPPPPAVQALRSDPNPQRRAQFDQLFGPGASDRALRGG